MGAVTLVAGTRQVGESIPLGEPRRPGGGAGRHTWAAGSLAVGGSEPSPRRAPVPAGTSLRGPSGFLPGWLSGPGRPNLSSGLRIVESVGVTCGRGRSAGFVSTHQGLGSTTRRRTGVVEDTRGLWRPLAPGWALEGKGRGKGRKVLARR